MMERQSAQAFIIPTTLTSPTGFVDQRLFVPTTHSIRRLNGTFTTTTRQLMPLTKALHTDYITMLSELRLVSATI
jgi:hypothetical protein